MKPTTRLYLTAFLITGVPYGLIMIGIDLATGIEFKLWKFLFLIFFFGTTMSLILVSFHIKRLKRIGITDFTLENLKVSLTRVLKSELNLQELIEKLQDNPTVGKMRLQKIENGILLKSGISWKSWGEEIKITLTSTHDTEFEYQVSSRPKMKATLLDYGKNLENVNRIESIITNQTKTII